MVDHFYPLTEDPYANLSAKERSRYFQMPPADTTAGSSFEMRDEQSMSKVAPYMTSSPTEQLLNETAHPNAKPRLRYQLSLPSTPINGILPLIDFKEKPNDGTKKVGSATVVPQNHGQPVNTGQTHFHRERDEMPAALLGGVIGSGENSAEICNQAGPHDIHQGQSVETRRAPSWAPLPEPTTLSSDLPRTTDLTREMQAHRKAFRSSRDKKNRLFYEKFSQQKDRRADLPVTSDLARQMQAHREAVRLSQKKSNRLFHENLFQQKDNLDVANKPRRHHSIDLAAKERTSQHLPQTPILRPAREQSRVASATLPDHQHQTREADGESRLGKIPPLQSSAGYAQPTSSAALLDCQAHVDSFEKLHQVLNRSKSDLSDDELEMIHPFMRKLGLSIPSAEPLNLQEELTMPLKPNMAQKGPRKIEDKRELNDAMVRDLHKQYGQARSTQMPGSPVSLSGGLQNQDIHATWSESEVANTSHVDSHCSQKKAPVDGSYLAEEERKVLDHVRGSMSTTFPVTKVQDGGSMSTGGYPEPARRLVFANSSMEDLHMLNDYPILREKRTSRVACVRPIGCPCPLDGNFSQGSAPKASTSSLAQAYKATQTYPGKKIDAYDELDPIKAKAFHARFFCEPSQTLSSTTTGTILKPASYSITSAAINTITSRIPVRENTVRPPLYETLSCRPIYEKADVSFSGQSAPATCDRPIISKMQSSGAQTARSVSKGHHSKVTNDDSRISNSQMEPVKVIPNRLHRAQIRRDQRGQVTRESTELLGMLQDTSNGISPQASNDTPIAEDHAESTAKPIVTNKLHLSEEKREQMIKEGPRSLRDFQRAVGCIDFGTNPLGTSHPPLSGSSSLKPAVKKSATSKILRSVTEKGEQYHKPTFREFVRNLHEDFESDSQTRGQPGIGSGHLEPAKKPTGSASNLHPFNHMEQLQEFNPRRHNNYRLEGSRPQTMNKPRGAKGRVYSLKNDVLLSKPSCIMDSEGQRMEERDYALEDIRCGGSLRRTEYTNAKINPPTTDCTSSAAKRKKRMREFWSQPTRFGSSHLSMRDAMCNLPSSPLTPDAELRFDSGGPDIDNWRKPVDFEFKTPSAAPIAATKGKLIFRKESILGSAPAEHEDPKSTSLPWFTPDVVYNPSAAQKATTYSSRNGISISTTCDAGAPSADANADVYVAGDEDEDNGKGDQSDWSILDSDYSSSRVSLVDSNEVLEAAPSELSDPSSMDVEVGDDGSEVNEEEWIIC